MSESSENKRKKVNLNKILIYTLLVVIIITSIVFLVKTLIELKKSSELQSEAFKKQMDKLNNELASEKGNYRRMTQNRDSLQEWVNYYHPMRSLIYNAKLRDQVVEALEFNPGDVAKFKIDSSSVVILDVKVSGNDLNYTVHYLVKNRKGEVLEVSPYELFIPKEKL
jgi:Sec-independent protein translocase protein TatA